MRASTIALLSLLASQGFADEGPTLVPTSLVVTASSHDGYAKKPGDHFIRSWTPRIQLTLLGPVAPGSQLIAEFLAGKQVWASIGMLAPELAGGKLAKLEGGSDMPHENGSVATGAIPFQIRLKNELMGTDAVLFKGSFTVDKFAGNEPQRKNGSFEYFVDQDAWLPYGAVWLDHRDPQAPTLMASMWVRGQLWPGKDIVYLFHDGKPICDSSAEAKATIGGPSFTNSPGGESRTWQRAEISFNCARASSSYPDNYGVHEPQFFFLSTHPGTYDIKLMRSGKLSRTMSFSADKEGNVEGTGLVLVQILVDSEDGQKLDKSAGKKGIYGNPVPGLNP